MSYNFSEKKLRKLLTFGFDVDILLPQSTIDVDTIQNGTQFVRIQKI